MGNDASPQQYGGVTPPAPRGASGTAGLLARGLPRFVLLLVVMPSFLCAVSGHWDWVMVWFLTGALAVCMCANMAVLMALNREVVAERLLNKSPAKAWDNPVRVLMSVGSMAALIVAALGKRFGWPSFPLWLQIGGFGLLVLGILILTWAMSVNKFFARVVRIQTERSHAPVMVGPYRFIRHPGYIGFSTMGAAILLILGSPWAFIPGLASFAVLMVRTAFEDKTLRAELDGYAAYAERVRYRLFPGLW